MHPATILGPQRIDGLSYAFEAIFPITRAMPAEWEMLLDAIDARANAGQGFTRCSTP